MNNFTDFTEKYKCEFCNILCSRESEWKRHILTQKHLGNATGNKNFTKPLFTCEKCNKEYKSNKGLWGHSKLCNNVLKNASLTINENTVIDSSSNELKMLTSLVLEIVKSNIEVVKSNSELQKQNQELQKQVLDVCKNIQPASITTNSNNNNHNKTFNMQFFLNEECKDAMNLKDFVQSFHLQLSDLELVGDEGYVDGMTKVILAKVNTTEVNKRPFHCSDAKRDTLYVKDDNVWAREGPENAKMVAAVKAIGHQNFTVLKQYKALHPDCESTYSEFNDHYMNLIMKSAGSQPENLMKVVKKLAKEVVIEK